MRALFLLLVACSSSSTPQDAGTDAQVDTGPPPPAQVDFPPGFLWGSATAGFQVESGNQASDWGHWVEIAGKIKNGDKPDVGGPDALAHVDEDIAALTSSGQNAYRLSLEWYRLYPTRKAFDDDTPDATAVTAYTTLLTKLRAAKITPMVTLSHFALPDWLADVTKPQEPYGWERPETSDLFTEWCTRMGKRFGADVDYWVTINEPLNVVLGGYVEGSFPPGLLLEVSRALGAAKKEAVAHARCYDALHVADTIDADKDGKAAQVGYAAHLRTFHPYDKTDPADTVAAERLRYLWNDWFLNAVIRGDWDDDLDGKLDGPTDKKADPALIHRADYAGVNYYSDTLVSSSVGIQLPVINVAVFQTSMPTDRPKTDFGWDIYAEGLGTVMDEVGAYGLPVFITENGIADSKDTMRAKFIAEHLFHLGWARQRGVDVRGYFHWALLDNFEWASGFCPKFGLYSVDPTTRVRTPRPSMTTYKSIAQSNKVLYSDVQALSYGSPTKCN